MTTEPRICNSCGYPEDLPTLHTDGKTEHDLPMTLEEIQDMLWEQEKKKNPRSLIPYSGNPSGTPSGTQRMKSVLDA